MNTSDSITELAKAVVQFHGTIGKIPKTDKNPFFKSKYASLSTILGAISGPLTDSGLAVIQTPHGCNELTTRLIHLSGEWIEDTYTMTPTKNDPQGLGSAITYQRRYALGAILSLNIDDDDDGNAASQPSPRPAEKANQPKPAKPPRPAKLGEFGEKLREQIRTVGGTTKAKADKIVKGWASESCGIEVTADAACRDEILAQAIYAHANGLKIECPTCGMPNPADPCEGCVSQGAGT